MRVENKTSEAGIKWYDIDLMPLAGDDFAVVISYGVRTSNKDEVVLQPAISVFQGPYLQALDILSDKVKDRLNIGYIKVEPKQVNE